MRKFFSTLFVVLIGLIFVTFAVANRHFVTVSFDPFNSASPSISVSMPLFALIIVVAILGVIAGGCASWFGQRRWRRAARTHEADARTVRAQLAELRSQTQGTRQGSPGEAQRLALPASFYGAAGRDKQGATL
ncbi:MAG: LapA family protein [Bradyrhizobium sp.]|nr:LapA family protein [Bradyrhizobium sp.]